jgi:hypothetical protein
LAEFAPTLTEDTVNLGVLDELIGYHMRRASAVMAGDFSRALDAEHPARQHGRAGQ